MAKQVSAKKSTARKATTKGKATKKAVTKKGSPSKKTAATKSTSRTGNISSINVRMYRAGTGDFFLLKFKQGAAVAFKMMIDCGCIKGGASTFVPYLTDLKKETDNSIDLLVVTHEHADHINGFQSSATTFQGITFKKVWFAWTEDKTDKTANEYRKKYTKTKMAIAAATQQLNSLKTSGHFEKIFANQMNLENLKAAHEHFLDSINELAALNGDGLVGAVKTPTMADILKNANVIKDAEVEFLSPGDIRTDLPGAPGIRFFVLGPPRDLDRLSQEEKVGEGYQKREHPSNADFALVNALTSGSNPSSAAAFDREYEMSDKVSDSKMQAKMAAIKTAYDAEPWRQIDYDWLYGAGSLALRFQRSINNTSLVLAIQFEATEKVLLFPGDAEYGNWMSWHDGLQWTILQDGKQKKVDAEYLLNNTVFYKVGHHLSQNGTAKAKGLEMMNHEYLSAMATLDFKKINDGWLNTMPSDLVGEELIRKTAGRLFFVGDYKKILENIKTSRVTVKQANENNLIKLNEVFEGKNFIDWEVTK